MNSQQALSKKVILVGNFGVGKTSLTNRFVYQKFSNDYLTTLGVRIDKKLVELEDKSVNILLWDIAGEVAQEKVNKSYYLGAEGVIYVFDLTRPSTYENIQTDIAYIRQLLPNAKIVLVGNKLDLVQDVNKINLNVKYDYLTSAKTGDHVEQMFLDLAIKLT